MDVAGGSLCLQPAQQSRRIHTPDVSLMMEVRATYHPSFRVFAAVRDATYGENFTSRSPFSLFPLRKVYELFMRIPNGYRAICQFPRNDSMNSRDGWRKDRRFLPRTRARLSTIPLSCLYFFRSSEKRVSLWRNSPPMGPIDRLTARNENIAMMHTRVADRR